MTSFPFASVVNASYLFANCVSFDQSVQATCSHAIVLDGMFLNTSLRTATITVDLSEARSVTQLFAGIAMGPQGSITLLGNNTTGQLQLTQLFLNATQFNAPLYCSQLQGVVSAASLLQGCALFNQPVQLTASLCTNLSSMFDGCVSLNSDVLLVTTALCTTFSSMFRNCSSLSSGRIQGLDFTSSVSVASMFDGCIAYPGQALVLGPNTQDTSYLLAHCARFLYPVTVVSLLVSSAHMFDGALLYNYAMELTVQGTDLGGMFNNTPSWTAPVTLHCAGTVSNVSQLFNNTGFTIVKNTT